MIVYKKGESRWGFLKTLFIEFFNTLQSCVGFIHAGCTGSSQSSSVPLMDTHVKQDNPSFSERTRWGRLPPWTASKYFHKNYHNIDQSLMNIDTFRSLHQCVYEPVSFKAMITRARIQKVLREPFSNPAVFNWLTNFFMKQNILITKI